MVIRKELPSTLTKMPKELWPVTSYDTLRTEVWASKKYVVQVFDEGNCLRVSVKRTSGSSDMINWDELMNIKRRIGRGEEYAVEVLPKDADIINVCSMRHFWILPQPIIGWRRDVYEASLKGM